MALSPLLVPGSFALKAVKAAKGRERVQRKTCIPLLKALADPSRWRIVQALLTEPRTVNGLTRRLHLSQYNTSKHLRILREAGIVTAKKEGTFLLCQIAPNFRRRLARNKNLLDLGCCTFRFNSGK